MIDFVFNRKTQRYQYKGGDRSGQFVAVSKLQDLMESYIQTKQKQAISVTDSLLKRDISVGTWETAIAKELKEAHILAFSVGKGGTKNLSARDYGLLGVRLKSEYRYLRQFSTDILDGKLTPAQIRARIAKYQSSLYASFEQGRLESHIASGFRWERNIRTAKESCQSCIDRSARGWVPIGTMPGVGIATLCKMNDRCFREFSDSMVKPATNMLKQNYGWLTRV